MRGVTASLSDAIVALSSLIICRWDKSLASLLNTLTKHLGKRLAFERSPRDAEDRQQQASERVPLDEASLRRIVQLLVRVAGRAQYSKVRDCSHLLEHMSHTFGRTLSILRLPGAQPVHSIQHSERVVITGLCLLYVIIHSRW